MTGDLGGFWAVIQHRGIVGIDPGDRPIRPVGHALGHGGIARDLAGPSGMWNRVLSSQEPFWIWTARGSGPFRKA